MSSPETREGAKAVRALIVDDTPDIRFMVGFQLKMQGMSFEEAGSGEEALKRCATESFDLVVLDFRMPGLSGLDVAKKLRDDQYAAQIVIYSAYVDEALQSAARRLDITAVDKSDNERLLDVVRKAVRPVPA